jgi:putative heme-binding domain-containing protein
LTGAGANGVRYFLENIMDPNAVIGNNYRLAVAETADGEVVSGLKERESGTTVTLRTLTGPVTLEKSKVSHLSEPEQSMMPEGLLEGLKEREVIELLKFLVSG